MLSIAVVQVASLEQAYSHSANDSTIYSFGTQTRLDGAVPKGTLTYFNGLMFGRTTTVTPSSGDGIIFHFNPNNVAGTYTIDHLFTGAPSDGENPRHDAMTPFAGVLYGTTLQGGTHDNGMIFSFAIGRDPSPYAPLMSLHNSIGDEPHSCFVVVNNLLYGMTAHGGENDDGVIFSFDPATFDYEVIYSFDSPTGKEPHGRLTLDPNGTTLYGMTRKGGSGKLGVVFSVDTSGNNYQPMHNFMGGPNDGATTDHGYLVQCGSVLYGMTINGGLSDKGVIFSINTDGSNFHVLYKFGTAHHDGKNPYGSLLLVGNQLYGTCAKGGDNGAGTVFMINTDGSGYTKLHDFGGSKHDGAKPIDNVIMFNGSLYGMTTEGGAFDQGAIFMVP